MRTRPPAGWLSRALLSILLPVASGSLMPGGACDWGDALAADDSGSDRAGWLAPTLSFLTADAEARAARHRRMAVEAHAAKDWLTFAAHLRLHALLRIVAIRQRLPPNVARRRTMTNSVLEGAAADAGGTGSAARRAERRRLSALFAVVPAVRLETRRSPALRAMLAALLRPPRGVRELRLPGSPSAVGTAADHLVSGTALNVRFSPRLSSPAYPPQDACATAIFEFCNARGILARRELDALAARRALTRSGYVAACVDLERIAVAETQLALASLIDAHAPPWPVDLRPWFLTQRYGPAPDRAGPFERIETRGYPWAWFGQGYECGLLGQYTEHSPPRGDLWPAWVAIHRLPEYRAFDGQAPYLEAGTRHVRWWAAREPLYVLLDALPPAITRRFYLTPDVERLDLLLQAVADAFAGGRAFGW